MKYRGIIFAAFGILMLMSCSSESSDSQTAEAKAPATKEATPAPPPQPAYSAGNEGWLVDLDEAYALSQEKGVPIMANFTGSDWCGWCKRLTAAVFSKDEFKNWADDNVVLLELDFPRRTKIPEKYVTQNRSLQRKFQVRGFPTIHVFNLEKNAQSGQYQFESLGRTGYAPSVGEFTGAVDQMLGD